MAHLKHDHTGQRFGRLLVIDHLGSGRWRVRCDCGTEKVVSGGSLRAVGPSSTRSCGCGKPSNQSGADHPRHQGSRIAYATARKRVAALRGRAREHSCLICGGQATSWAYRGGSPLELWEWREDSLVKKGWLRYSPDPADYDPLCRSCHARKDVLEAKTRA